MKVSILILTFNEEKNLGRCLESLSWCDDIILVDSGSTDRTVEIAQAFRVRILHRPFDNFAEQRNFGLNEGQPQHEWVLHLDADEVLTPSFIRELDKLQVVEGIDAYRIPSKTILHGSWLKHAGMYPTYQVRLGHRERLRFIQVGHGQREKLPPERVGTFSEPYLHYNFSHGLSGWLSKHLRYAEDEARLMVEQRRGTIAPVAIGDARSETDRRRRLKMLANRMPLMLRPPARFFYILFWRRGFLDGRNGALYALMLSVYEGMIAIIAADMMRGKRQDGF